MNQNVSSGADQGLEGSGAVKETATLLRTAATALLSAVNAATLKPTQAALWMRVPVPPEKRNIAYSGYTDLAQQDAVYELVADCVAQVNADLSRESELANSQIHRFLILHKELEADDGELTRTRKVRRRFIGEKYGSPPDTHRW